jgi:hypothetical protein
VVLRALVRRLEGDDAGLDRDRGRVELVLAQRDLHGLGGVGLEPLADGAARRPLAAAGAARTAGAGRAAARRGPVVLAEVADVTAVVLAAGDESAGHDDEQRGGDELPRH